MTWKGGEKSQSEGCVLGVAVRGVARNMVGPLPAEPKPPTPARPSRHVAAQGDWTRMQSAS